MSLRIRRGGDVSQVTPPVALYGPVQGAAAVRSGAGPLTVPDPGGGISFNSSSSLQNAINAAPVGSTFVCSVNNPPWNSTVSTGTRSPTIVFPGPVGQKVIDGGSNSFLAVNAGANTRIKGGTWQNFGVLDVSGNHCMIINDDVTIEDAVVTGAGDKGIDIQGHRAVLRRLDIHANGIVGFGTGTTGLGQADDLLIENCHIYGNNTALHEPGNRGGAFKIVFSGRGTCRNNWVHDNIGFGIWWDTNNFDWLIENNVCENNYYSGVMFEANYGSVIRNNYVLNNGKGISIPSTAGGNTFPNQANVRLSDNAADRVNPDGVITPIQVSRNIIDHTTFGLTAVGWLILVWDHTDSVTRHAANTDIFENQFWLRSPTLTGAIQNKDLDVIGTITTNFQLWDSDVNYFSNEYRVASTSTAYWRWDTGTGTGADKTYAQWQAFHPGETIPRIQI